MAFLQPRHLMSAYTVEVSSDLLTWTSNPPEIVTLTETPTQLVLRHNTPIQQLTARFIRLRISTGYRLPYGLLGSLLGCSQSDNTRET